MNLSDIKSTPFKRSRRRRVGRGRASGRGKTSTRGMRGEGQRSGNGIRLLYQGGQTPLFMRLPKRGFNNARYRKVYSVVNVGRLNQLPDGTEVNPEFLLKRGVVRKVLDGVKVLGDGELTKKLVVKAHHFSRSAVEKIQGAGGSVVIIDRTTKDA